MNSPFLTELLKSQRDLLLIDKMKTIQTSSEGATCCFIFFVEKMKNNVHYEN